MAALYTGEKRTLGKNNGPGHGALRPKPSAAVSSTETVSKSSRTNEEDEQMTVRFSKDIKHKTNTQRTSPGSSPLSFLHRSIC